MITKIKIFDCDGVLLDSSHRYKTMIKDNGVIAIDLQHWRNNEFRAYNDTPLPTALGAYKKALNCDETYVIIATAAILCDNRIRCLRDKIGLPNHIIGRKNHADNRGGAELKIAGLNKLLSLKQFLNAKNNMTVYEDNITYLSKLCKTFICKGVYIPSVQGH